MHTLVLALNPCIDAEWRVEKVRWDEKTSVLAERRWAGGKGVNVARWVQYLACKVGQASRLPHQSNVRLGLARRPPALLRGAGGTPALLLTLGGQAGAELARYLRSEKLVSRAIHLREATRVNVLVTTSEGPQLRFNPPGPRLSGSEWRLVAAAITRLLRRSNALVLSGSLPRGVPATAYAQLVRTGQEAGVPVLLDCDGPAFNAASRAKPFLVKPNEHELEEWWASRPASAGIATGESPLAATRRQGCRPSLANVLSAARALSETTGGWVLVSRGARPSLLINRTLDAELYAKPPRVTPLNTLGAGDAMLAAAAWQIELGAPPAEWLRWGVAAGTAATQCRPGELPSLKLILRLFSKTGILPVSIHNDISDTA